MLFITLRFRYDSSPVRVSVGSITYYYESIDYGQEKPSFTIVSLGNADEDRSLSVEESMEEIDALIAQAEKA